MTKEEEETLRIFETRVRQMILQCRELRKENEGLRTVLDEKERVIGALGAENDKLRMNYANLKLAKMIEISDDDMRNARLRLSKLVRDVDKCIALLNV